MKSFTLTQAQKQHNVNALHDAFIAASLIPIHVDSTAVESRFQFDDSVLDAAINAVVSAYVFSAPVVPMDVRQKWQAYLTAVNNATTIAQVKTALTNDLGVLLKELLRSRIGDL